MTIPALLEEAEASTIYTRTFWLSYLANGLAVTANALTFRFADYVAFLMGRSEGTEQTSGNIVSIGVIVAVLVRLGLGQALDRYGTRLLWLFSSALFALSCGLFLLQQHVSWELYAARIIFSVGLAGMFSCSIVHVQNLVPSYRRTEVIGSLGSSGFIGMIAGPLVGDGIFRLIPAGHARFIALFGVAAVLGCTYFGLVVFLTQGEKHQRPHETPGAHRLIFRYWPGMIVLVAMMMGIGFTVISVFLTRFATFLHLQGIGTFFVGYAMAAFTFRLGTRNWGTTVAGCHRMVLIGLCGIGFGQYLFLFVSAEWHLIVPALSCGFGHALLFPAVVSLGAGAFPPHYRGTGTTLVLGFSEIGTVIFAPLLGAIIDYFNDAGFPQMFIVTGCTSFGIAILYAVTAARKPDHELQWEQAEAPHEVAILAVHPDLAALPLPEGGAAMVIQRIGKSA